jgi:hypothetical protein
MPLSATEAAAAADLQSGVARDPWSEGAVKGAAEPAQGKASGRGQGGASDTFRPGASDAFRR